MAVIMESSESPAAAAVRTRTIARLIRERAMSSPNQVALRHKDLGIWRETTWSRYWEQVLLAAHGLLSLGVDTGDRVSIHSEDRPEWVILDVATVAVRGITVGLYPTNPAAEVRYLLSDSGSRVHLAEDQEQADKLMEVIDALPDLERVIHVEPRGFRTYRNDPRFVFWDEFLEMGRSHRAENPGAVEERMREADPDDVMTLVYTSGTTGPPKGAMLDNANAEYCFDELINADSRMPDNIGPNPSDEILTYLPLCHVAERIFSTWTSAVTGTTLNFAESIETVQENLREVQPTLFFAVPRIWEKLHASVILKSRDATRFKRLLMSLCSALARVIGRQRANNGGRHTLRSGILFMIGYPLVFRALRERIGLRRCRWAATGAAPIAPEVIEFFHGLGVNLYELYGMTENAGFATNNFYGRMKLGTVGEPYPGIGFRIDPETGEIQTRHPGVFRGYWNKPEETAEAFTPDGWLRTGDVGEWVDGTHVKIVDRIKHIIITSGGKNVSPSEIENSLKTSPFVKEAMVIGDRRNYLTALVGIEFDTVGDWATRRNIPYTTYRDLGEKPEVLELIQGVITRTNSRFSRVENIRKFRMLPKELDHEDGELTATQKLKRESMEEMFEELIIDMYSSRS
ncbi:MAG: AMP-binding protein [bacterium]|nr:AMP-binding protein [bacterium]MDE0602575.1 AMP-binding protein [bacterium]